MVGATKHDPLEKIEGHRHFPVPERKLKGNLVVGLENTHKKT